MSGHRCCACSLSSKLSADILQVFPRDTWMNPLDGSPLLSFGDATAIAHQAVSSGVSTQVEYIPNEAGPLQLQVSPDTFWPHCPIFQDVLQRHSIISLMVQGTCQEGWKTNLLPSTPTRGQQGLTHNHLALLAIRNHAHAGQL